MLKDWVRWNSRAIDPAGLASVDGNGGEAEFLALLARRDVHVVFQPVVELSSGAIVGMEALARGPASSPFASPLALFAAARRSGRVAELDWVCRALAFEAFLVADLPPAMSLFVNIEPESLTQGSPPDLAQFVARAESVLRVFVEVNDRSLAADPAGVFAAVERARQMGWGVAIDDVGGSRASVTMLPIVQADVVKLDLRRLNQASASDSAEIITSVLRHVERTGASLLVEGIETEADTRWARALGASYGQGHHLGVPGPLLKQYPVPRDPVRLVTIPSPALQFSSPFELMAKSIHQQMGRPLLGQLAQVIADRLPAADSWPVILASTGTSGGLGQSVVGPLVGLVKHPLLFVAFGSGLPPEPAPGVRGVRLRDHDPLVDEECLIVLSTQEPVALLARPAPSGYFEVAFTQDPELVHAIAHHLICRVPEPGRDNSALPAPTRDLGQDLADRAPVQVASKPSWRERIGLGA